MPPLKPVASPVWSIPKRGPVGGQWWTQDILAGLDRYLDRGRMSRGAAYARAGKVVGATVEPGFAEAFVMGSRGRPYETAISWQIWSGAPLSRLMTSLAQHRDVLAALLANDLPPAFEGLLQESGLSLVPQVVGGSRYHPELDLAFFCSCPDWGYPCKHGAALLLALLHRFDEEPRLLLRFRGLEPEQCLAPVAGTAGEPTGTFYRAGAGYGDVPVDVRPHPEPTAILRAMGPLDLSVGRHAASSALIEAYDIIAATAAVWGRELLGDGGGVNRRDGRLRYDRAIREAEGDVTVESPVQTRRWTRDEYDRLIDLGFFHDERLELLDGEIVTMTPQKSQHATAVYMTQKALEATFDPGYMVRSQLPLATDAMSAPEPDIAVVAGMPVDFRDAHPQHAALVVEVSDTTLRQDRQRKGPIYARAGVPEYWIVNLVDRVVEVYREPFETAEGWIYRLVRVCTPAETITPLQAPTATIKAGDLLP